MAETTGIAWCDATWNPWTGCTKVSAGCDNCYMYRQKGRWGHDPSKVTRSADKTFNLPLAKKQDGSWKIPSGSLVFVCSWSDFFHPAAVEWAADAWEVMQARPDLTFLLLTKRLEHFLAGLAQASGVQYVGSPPPERLVFIRDRARLAHIWLGVTAENQAMADERIPALLDIDWPGKKFVSIEPMLGPVDLGLDACSCNGGAPGGCDFFGDAATECPHNPQIDWVICGGESGPNNRAINADWVRSLRDQCVEAGVPFFLKQYSAVRPAHMPKLDGKVWAEKPTAKGG